MSAKLTKKQEGFVKDYIDTGNGVQSALNNYDVTSYSSAGAIASQNLKKLKIQEYLADKAEDASTMVYKLSQEAEAEAIRLSASKDILDRAGFKPIEKIESKTLNVISNTLDPKVLAITLKYEEELKRLL
ncbi:MAG: terminase small subunit [Candidatus Zambryskibacteria bacterium]|nr:terminase small subunit [Candidatus Zambryskibacteria bacterium]